MDAVASDYYRAMIMTIRDTHLANLELLIRRFGSLDKLLDAVVEAGQDPISKKYIQQVQKGWKGKKYRNPRDLGIKVCRRLEKAAGEPEGWMDFPNAPDVSTGSNDSQASYLRSSPIKEGVTLDNRPWALGMGGAATSPFPAPEQPGPADLSGRPVPGPQPQQPWHFGPPTREKMLHIPVLNIEGSLGTGREAPDHEVVASQISVSESWLRRNLAFSAPGNLSIIAGVGDSMKPTFSDGDLLLVDRGVSEIRVDAVYVLELHNRLYIKRLQIRPDGAILMLSDNKAYEPYLIQETDMESVHVRARVLMAWNANKL